MGCFESVEAEGRQFGQGVLRGVYGAREGEAVPTRVLFDWRGGVGVGVGEEEEEEEKKGVEGGWKEMEMGMGMEEEGGGETDQGVRARLDVLCEDGNFGPGREGGRGEGVDVDVFCEFTNVGDESGHER